MTRARIDLSWTDASDDVTAQQAVEFGCKDLLERMALRHVEGAKARFVFDPVPQPRVGLGCLVLHQGKLLMLRRAGSHGAGAWSIPGGHLETGETPESAAEREVLEETGVVVKAIKRLPYTSDFPEDWTTHYITLFILCEYVSGQPVVTEPEKCQDVGWVLLSGVTCRELFLPVQHFLDENPNILQLLAAQRVL